MKILFLTPGCFDKGGISRYCRYQIEALRTLFGETNVTVLSLLGPDETSFETPIRVDWNGRSGGLWDKMRFSHQALRSALSARPDVIHVAHVNLTPLAVQAARISGAHTILNVYGLEIWSGLSDRRRRSVRAIDQLMADCHFTSDYVTKAQIHASQPKVIWDCVDLDRFCPGSCPPETLRKYGLPNKSSHFVIMTLGRLDRASVYKGYDRLLQVFAQVHRLCPDARLVIAGQGNDRRRLETVAENCGLEGVISFTGAIAEDDLADVYRSATVFSLVSDWGHGRGEGIPLTPLEAMSCGVPIVVGNQDGSREAVISDQGGFSIDPLDLDRHAEVLLMLARSPEILQAMRTGARSSAMEFFGYDRFVEQHSSLYEDMWQEGESKRCRSDLALGRPS